MKQQFLRRALGGALSIGLLMQPALAAVTPDIPQGWTTPFSDVAEGDWYTPFVSTLNSQGVINGYDDGRFGPNDAVRAGDAILMVVKAAGSGNQPALEGACLLYTSGPRYRHSGRPPCSGRQWTGAAGRDPPAPRAAAPAPGRPFSAAGPGRRRWEEEGWKFGSC